MGQGDHVSDRLPLQSSLVSPQSSSFLSLAPLLSLFCVFSSMSVAAMPLLSVPAGR